MKNLTDKQKEILKNLETEFLKLNTPLNTKSNGLININKIKSLLSEAEKESKEIDLWNELQQKLHEDYKAETFAKLSEALDEMGIECKLKGNSIAIKGLDKCIYFRGLKIDYIKLGNEQVKSKYTFNIGLSIYFNPNSDTKFDTLEELCGHESFEKMLVTICK